MKHHDDPHGGRSESVQIDRPLAGGESDHDLWGELLDDEPDPDDEDEEDGERD